MRGEVHILVYCPIDTLQWGSTHSALGNAVILNHKCDKSVDRFCRINVL